MDGPFLLKGGISGNLVMDGPFLLKGGISGSLVMDGPFLLKGGRFDLHSGGGSANEGSDKGFVHRYFLIQF
jgi:hypothetical protein